MTGSNVATGNPSKWMFMFSCHVWLPEGSEGYRKHQVRGQGSSIPADFRCIHFWNNGLSRHWPFLEMEGRCAQFMHSSSNAPVYQVDPGLRNLPLQTTIFLDLNSFSWVVLQSRGQGPCCLPLSRSVRFWWCVSDDSQPFQDPCGCGSRSKPMVMSTFHCYIPYCMSAKTGGYWILQIPQQG